MSLSAALAELHALASRAPSAGGRVALDLADDVAWIHLDSPGAHNALSVAMMIDLAAAVDRLRTWPGRAVVLASTTAGIFCSGGHLDEVQRALLDTESGERMAKAMGEVLDTLLDLPLVSVAAVDGPAIGGGAELTTACDFRVMSRGARIHFVHARLGVAPGWGGAGRLVRHLGRRTALRLLAEARPVGAEEARSLGLADAVVDGPAEDGALAFLEPIRALSAPAIRAVKAQVAAAGDPEAQAARFAEVWGGPDHRAALEAVQARRRSGDP